MPFLMHIDLELTNWWRTGRECGDCFTSACGAGPDWLRTYWSSMLMSLRMTLSIISWASRLWIWLASGSCISSDTRDGWQSLFGTARFSWATEAFDTLLFGTRSTCSDDVIHLLDFEMKFVASSRSSIIKLYESRESFWFCTTEIDACGQVSNLESGSLVCSPFSHLCSSVCWAFGRFFLSIRMIQSLPSEPDDALSTSHF